MSPKFTAIALITIIAALLIMWVIAPVVGLTALLVVGAALSMKAYLEGLI